MTNADPAVPAREPTTVFALRLARLSVFAVAVVIVALAGSRLTAGLCGPEPLTVAVFYAAFYAFLLAFLLFHPVAVTGSILGLVILRSEWGSRRDGIISLAIPAGAMILLYAVLALYSALPPRMSGGCTLF